MKLLAKILTLALFLCAFAVCANAHFFASSTVRFIATDAGRNLPDRGGVRVVDVVGSASTSKKYVTPKKYVRPKKYVPSKKYVRPTYRVQTSQYVARPKQHNRGEKIVGRVERWIDGDTCVFVADSGEKIRVRLWLVDAPESNQPGGSQATNYVRTHPHIGTGKRVLLYAVTTDKYGRTVGQLKGVNSERFATRDLLASGYFWPDYISVGHLSKSQSDQLKSVFNATRADKRGIFVNGSAVEPWRWRKAHTH